MANVHVRKKKRKQKSGNCECIAARGRPTSRQWFLAVLGRILIVLRMRTLCYFPASDQNSDIDIRCSDLDVLKESNNLAISLYDVFSCFLTVQIENVQMYCISTSGRFYLTIEHVSLVVSRFGIILRSLKSVNLSVPDLWIHYATL